MRSKHLVLAVVLVMMASASVAQQFNFGFKFGGNSVSLTPDNVQGYTSTSKLYTHFGGLAHYQIYKGFGLQMEVLYSAKGDVFNFDLLNDPKNSIISVEQKLNYLSVPVMFKYTFGRPRSGFHIDAGMTFNRLLKSKQSSTLSYVDALDNTIETPYDLMMNPLSTDKGLIFGLGLISNGIIFDFHLELGRDQIYESTPVLYNRTFMITAGYMF
jgi:hypothetical protein